MANDTNREARHAPRQRNSCDSDSHESKKKAHVMHAQGRYTRSLLTVLSIAVFLSPGSGRAEDNPNALVCKPGEQLKGSACAMSENDCKLRKRLGGVDCPGTPAKPLQAAYQKDGRRDFRGLNLRGAKLSKAYLQGADFSTSDLSGADLSGATLPEAVFREANLTGPTFREPTSPMCSLKGRT